MSTPSSIELSNAYYGDLPQYYEGQIKQTIGDRLKDADSAKYQFGTPSKAYLQGGMAENFKMYYGWAIPVRVNAKTVTARMWVIRITCLCILIII